MDVPPLLDDLAHLFALIFGFQVMLLTGAMVAGSLLVSFSILAVSLWRGRSLTQ